MPQTASPARTGWLVLALLLGLNLIPILAGTVRLVSLLDGAAVTPANARFVAQPAPVVAHIIAATLFCLLGAVQFQAGLRRRNLDWHRRTGRLLVPAGIVAGVAGLWMTLFYPHVENDGALLYLFRLVFGFGMILCIGLGYLAVRRRDIARHRAWMMRGYALALGAGTQAAIQIPWVIVLGEPGELPRSLLMGGAWILNLAVAEWLVRRPRGHPLELAATAQAG
jgi:uncharacterized membrane protein YozB (DUF420 family)